MNREGKFNVPFGYYKNAFIFDPENLRAASNVLNYTSTDLQDVDYVQALRTAKRGDVVYLDPPYDPIGGTSSFTEYTSSGFGLRDQSSLAQRVHQLIDLGCWVVLSNSPTQEIRELYRDLAQDVLLVPRAINCDGAKRGRTGELLIYPKSRRTLHDHWETAIDAKHFALDGIATYEIGSSELKRVSGGAEPRLIAKMDTRHDLPEVLTDSGYFVLPVAARRYAIVPGDGYHTLETPTARCRDFHPEREVPVTVALKAGESAAIQTALYSGLLEKLIGVPQLRSTLHNDKVTLRNASIHYADRWKLRVDGAQVEIDAGFENHGEFYIFECKAWRERDLHDFNIRQLFFPQLHALGDLHRRGLDLKPRCFFLNVDPDTATYRFWEYRFVDPSDYASIALVSNHAYRLIQEKIKGPIQLLESLLSLDVRKTDYIPQADDPAKLVTLVQGVAEGFATTSEIARRFGFDPRQSSYYGEAAEELGLIERNRGQSFTLTSIGSRLSKLETDEAAHEVISRIFTLPVFHNIAEKAIMEKTPALRIR